jgi:hypothetical protein
MKSSKKKKNLRTMIIISNSHHYFAMTKKLSSVCNKEIKAQRGNRFPKEVVRLVVVIKLK